MEKVGDFVVGADIAVVGRARTRTLRIGVIFAGFELAMAVVISMLAALMVWLVGAVGLLNLPSAVFLAVDAIRKLRRLRRLRDVWAAVGIPRTAMRMSTGGLTLSIDAMADHIFLPWDAVLGLRLHRWLGADLLVVDLYPEVDDETPGVVGLDHPDVQRMLHNRIHGTVGLRISLRILDQPVAALDQAAAHFTTGRIRVR
ncbi:hypothetical protein [Nocardia sp. NPDC004722]